jgi:hypothetical protein
LFHAHDMPWFALGRGSNLLVTDKGIRRSGHQAWGCAGDFAGRGGTGFCRRRMFIYRPVPVGRAEGIDRVGIRRRHSGNCGRQPFT